MNQLQSNKSFCLNICKHLMQHDFLHVFKSLQLEMNLGFRKLIIGDENTKVREMTVLIEVKVKLIYAFDSSMLLRKPRSRSTARIWVVNETTAYF